MTKFSLFTFLLFLSSGILVAQENSDVIRCYTTELHEQNMTNPEFAAEYENRIQRAHQYLQNNAVDGKMPPCTDILLIPVAVHFQGAGIDDACAEQMALDQVERMNLDFAGTNTDIGEWANAQASGFYPGINNKESCIQFCLATLNHPPGFGLNDGDYAITQDLTTGDNDPAWAGYLNFWVRDLGGGILGYSPLGGMLNGDGVACTLSAFSSISCGGNTVNAPYNLGRTMTHEVGHYFTLRHPFDSGNCTVDGDGIGDTPFTDAATFGCSNFGDVNCTDPKLWMSYMDYGDDPCLYMFSEGQVDDMEAHVNANLLDEIADGATKCQEAACINFEADADFENETCSGFDGQILMEVIEGNPPYGYSINGGVTYQTSPNYTNLTQGTYDVVILDDQGCEHTDEITILRDEAEIVLVSKENSFCGDGTGSIMVNVNEPSVFTYSIDGVNFQADPFFDNLNFGNYSITATNSVGCFGILNVQVEDDNDMDVVVDERNNINCFYFDNGSIEFHVLGAEPPVQYSLDSDLETSTIPSFDELTEGLHSIFIEDNRGCTETLDFEIIRSYSSIDDDCPCVVYVPNAMTPDEDSFNEVFDVKPSCPITNYQIEIFDRWGNIVFQSNDIDSPWNGAEKNGNYYVIDGLYFYRINYSWGNEFESTVGEVKVGSVLVLR